MFYHTLSQGVQIRLLELTDAEVWFETIERNRTELRPWMPWMDEFQTLEDSKRFIRVGMEQVGSGNGLRAALWHEGRIIGSVSCQEIDWFHRTAAIGCWIGADAQYRGLGTEASATLVRYLFETLKLRRVELRTAAHNHRAQAVARKLGFTLEGTVRQALWLHDRFVDEQLYARTADTSKLMPY